MTVHFENREKLVLKGVPKLKFFDKSAMEYNPIINSWWLKVFKNKSCEKTIFWLISCDIPEFLKPGFWGQNNSLNLYSCDVDS